MKLFYGRTPNFHLLRNVDALYADFMQEQGDEIDFMGHLLKVHHVPRAHTANPRLLRYFDYVDPLMGFRVLGYVHDIIEYRINEGPMGKKYTDHIKSASFVRFVKEMDTIR